MFPSGVLVKAGLSDLASGLPLRLTAVGPPRVKVEIAPEGSEPEGRPYLDVSVRSDGWCLIETFGPDELLELVVKSLVGTDPVWETLSCRFLPDTGEYGYALFREGKLLESFESRGSSMEAVNFTSDLRRVQLKEILKAKEFMVESLRWFGVVPGHESPARGDRTRFYVEYTGRKTFLKALLGAAWQK